MLCLDPINKYSVETWWLISCHKSNKKHLDHRLGGGGGGTPAKASTNPEITLETQL